MSTYSEAAALKQMLTAIVNETISNHPIIKRTLKANKCIVESPPNQQTHTIKVRLTPFDKTVIELPYAPKVPLSALQPGKCASVWYFFDVNNGIVMQNEMWTAYGQDDLENLASGELNLLEAVQILAEYIQQLNTTVESLKTTVDTLSPKVQDLTDELQTANQTIQQLEKSLQQTSSRLTLTNQEVQDLTARVTALENKSNN